LIEKFKLLAAPRQGPPPFVRTASMLDDQKLDAFAILPEIPSAALAICLATVSLYLVFG
jgi:hypothetical protein